MNVFWILLRLAVALEMCDLFIFCERQKQLKSLISAAACAYSVRPSLSLYYCKDIEPICDRLLNSSRTKVPALDLYVCPAASPGLKVKSCGFKTGLKL